MQTIYVVHFIFLFQFFVKSTIQITSLAKTLLPRDFCQKSVRQNFSNFNSVWKNDNFSLTIKIFVKSTIFLDYFISKKVISTRFLSKKCATEFLIFPQCAKNEIFPLKIKIFCQINSFSNLFSNTITFTKLSTLVYQIIVDYRIRAWSCTKKIARIQSILAHFTPK